MDVGGRATPAASASRVSTERPARVSGRTLLVTTLAILVITVLPPPPTVQALPTPGANVPIDAGPTDDRNPSLAVGYDGSLHVVRTENESSPRGAYYSRSAEGTSWSPTVRVDGGTGNVSFPEVAVEREAVPIRGRTYVAYQTEAGPNADVWVVSSDDGVTWSVPRKVDNAPAGNASITPSVAASRGRVYVAWTDGRDPAAFQVYFRASFDGGATWGAEVLLSSTGLSNLQPRVDAKGDTIVVAWRQLLASGPAIASARSEDAGVTWVSSTLSSVDTTGNIFAPDVFLDELLVAHAAWIEVAAVPSHHARYARSPDGVAWSPPVVVDDTIGPVSMRVASVSSLAGTIWVAWDDNREGDYDVYASWSNDGRTWGTGLVDGLDLRLDDTDRNAIGGDDATIQVGPSLRTGGFGVSAVWDDARTGSYDTYTTSVEVSPLVITEIQDSPLGDGRVEIFNFGRTAFDFTGVLLHAGSSVVDLSPLGAWPARVHAVVGGAGSDLPVPLDLGLEGAYVWIERGPDVLAAAGSGPYGIAPDPLDAESTARYAGTLDYASAWTRSIASTFGARNVVPPPVLAPGVVLNEVLFNPSAPGEAFVELFGRAPTDLTGFRLVGDQVHTFLSGTIGGVDPYAFFFDTGGPSWWSDVGIGGDNVYLYDGSGRLLDMFGWSSPHAVGASATRAPDGAGGTAAHDDASASGNGWAFDVTPTLVLVGLARDERVYADIGTTAQFLLTASNRQSTAEVLNVQTTSTLPNWPVAFRWSNGTALTDSLADSDSFPDLDLVPPATSVVFVADVQIPIEAPLGDGNSVTVSVRAASKPAASASVTLTLDLRPHFDVMRLVSPTTVYREGSGPPYNEVANVTVVLEGAGIPVEIQIPQDVVFQIDESGSMNGNDPSNLRVEAVKSYIDAMRADDRGALIGFTDVSWVVANRPLTYATPSGKADLKADADTLACGPINCAGWTNIESAILLGNSVLISQGDPARPRVEILLTDGVCAPVLCTNTSIIDQAVNEGIVIFTIGLGSGPDRVYLEGVANRTGGRYYHASTPQDLLQIYADIGTKINRTAGVDPDPTDATPMVEDVIAPYLNVIPGTFVDPATGAPRPPDFTARLSDRTVLQWNVSRVEINETWSVRFGVTSTRLGLQDVALHPDARVAYLRWDGSTVYQTIPQARLEVLEPPIAPFIASTAPAHLETDVALTQSIRLVFSEEMDAATVSWTLTPFVATVPAWTDARTLILDHQALAECAQYTVHVTSARDPDGNDLVPGPVPNPWSFTTICPIYARYTITRFPQVGDVFVDNAPYRAPVSFRWQQGEVHRITAIDLDPFGPSRLAFLSWDDGGSIDHTVTVGAVDTRITAFYQLQHPAAVTLVGLQSAWPARITYALFSNATEEFAHASFASWVDDGSSVEVEPFISGIAGERFLTVDPVGWLVTSPLNATVRYRHQFLADVTLEGLHGNPVSLEFTSFDEHFGTNTSIAWNAWVDASSEVLVQDLLSIGTRERYRTLDAVRWQVEAPLRATVVYIHQFRPRVILNGTDGQHTVGGTWQVDRVVGGKSSLHGEWFTWADAGSTLGFDNATTGTPPRTTRDSTSFVVMFAFDAIINYSAPRPPAPPVPEPNWKPTLAIAYAILLLVAGVLAGSRPLDRFVPIPPDGDIEKRRAEFAGLPLTEKLERLSLSEISEKVAHDRRFTRFSLAVPFALAEAGIGLLSLGTGVFRIPENGSWLPLGFWVNTIVLAAGCLVDLVVRRKGYRVSEGDLLAMAEARGREGRIEPPDRLRDGGPPGKPIS